MSFQLEAWFACVAALGVATQHHADAIATFHRLDRAYRQPWRVYHDRHHIAACLELCHELRSELCHPAAVEFAIWLHDAVYIPQRADNEVRSARWAGALLQRWQVRADWRSWVVSAILATQHGGDRTANQAANQVPNQATRSAGIAKPIGSEGLNCDSLPHTNPLSHPKLSPDRDRALMLDLDLSILAAPAPVFARYEAAIRDEYRYVSDEAFRLGRLAVLRSFLDRDRLFQSDIGLIRFEAQARQNLATAIARLDPLNPS